MAPKLVSLPVEAQGQDRATVAVVYNHRARAGGHVEDISRVRHRPPRDYFQTLRDYRDVMVARACRARERFRTYLVRVRRRTRSQIYNALPIVKKLGFTWVHFGRRLADRAGNWFRAEGLVGDADMRALVDKIHAEAQGSVMVGAAGCQPGTELVEEHPDGCCSMPTAASRSLYWRIPS